MQQLARKFATELSFQSGSVVGELRAPGSTATSMMRELVADGADLATAMLDVPSQLVKRLEHLNRTPKRSPQNHERLMLVDNWR